LEGSSASAQYSRPIDDGDVDGDQQVETDARDRIAYGSKRASRPKVVKHYVPEGMQSPSCGKPHRRVEHSEQAKGGVDANPHQLAHHPQGAFARPNGERHIRHTAMIRAMASKERPTMSLTKRERRNETTTSYREATAPLISKPTITGDLPLVCGARSS
jgi:hypothetical protein